MGISDNRSLFYRHLAQTSEFPVALEINKAKGIYVFDKKKKYIDLISGIGVSNIGHRHPKVTRAIKRQTKRYLHVMVYGEFIQSPQVLLAEALSQTLPDNINNVYILNSGSEAIEGALKLAKRYTGKPKIVSCWNAYHGSSYGALAASGDETFKQNYRPLVPGHVHIGHGCYDDLDKIDNETAAVLIETVQGEAGVVTSPKSWWSALQDRCREKGALLVLDEIQCGTGRTGTLWAFEQLDLEPDVVVMAKGLGGGMPIGCFASSKEIMSVLMKEPILGHITTFGGHPLCCAAALATLQVIKKEKLIGSVDEKANLFKTRLVHPKIKAIRNAGLLMALEFESFEIMKPVIDTAIKNGIITDWFLFDDKSMRIAPPLIITEKEINTACDLILASI